VLSLEGTIGPADVPELCRRVRRLLEETEEAWIVCDVARLHAPDAVAIDALARLQLAARRLGREIRLFGACEWLQDLLHITGLGEVLPACDELSLEARGQLEQREPSSGIEEERDAADPIP
jgi:anti-anti-sigma regulatory factor